MIQFTKLVKKENIINFGTYAVNSLRMEKAYRGWGAELTGEISLVEAGMKQFFWGQSFARENSIWS